MQYNAWLPSVRYMIVFNIKFVKSLYITCKGEYIQTVVIAE